MRDEKLKKKKKLLLCGNDIPIFENYFGLLKKKKIVN